MQQVSQHTLRTLRDQVRPRQVVPILRYDCGARMSAGRTMNCFAFAYSSVGRNRSRTDPVCPFCQEVLIGSSSLSFIDHDRQREKYQNFSTDLHTLASCVPTVLRDLSKSDCGVVLEAPLHRWTESGPMRYYLRPSPVRARPVIFPAVACE